MASAVSAKPLSVAARVACEDDVEGLAEGRAALVDDGLFEAVPLKVRERLLQKLFFARRPVLEHGLAHRHTGPSG